MESVFSSAEVVAAINTIWVMVTAFLVFLMQLGFGMLEAGFTRAKNVANLLMKNLMDFSWRIDVISIESKHIFRFVNRVKIEHFENAIEG